MVALEHAEKERARSVKTRKCAGCIPAALLVSASSCEHRPLSQYSSYRSSNTPCKFLISTVMDAEISATCWWNMGHHEEHSRADMSCVPSYIGAW